MWERFFNWQSDMDWAWGPCLSLRPLRNQPIQPWVWTRLFLVFSLSGLLLLGLATLLCALLPKMAAAQHQPLPPLVSETISALRSMLSDPATAMFLIGMLFSLPILFFGFCLPYHWAWNQRAARLHREMPTVESIEPGVWPPAPEQAG